MLPFGMIGVTVLTVVMPRLSRNAAADDIPAVLADLSLATRLTMVTLIPIVAMMTVGGPAIGSALFAYGNFGEVDAGYLGMAITLVGVHADPVCPCAASASGVLRPRAAVDADRADRRDHDCEDRRVAGRALPDRRPGIGGRLSRPGQRARLPGRRHGRLLPAARQPQSPRRAAHRPRGGAHHPGDDRRIADRRAHRPRRRSAARARGADPQLGRRRLAAAAARARADHGADHRRGHAGRPGARRAGRPGRRAAPPRQARDGSRTADRPARPATPGWPPHVL